jgi:hypothetical protein
MAVQGLPGLFVDVSSSANTQANNRRVVTWSRTVSPLMFGVSTPMLGTLPVPPVPQNCYLMQTGTPEMTFSSGAATWTFPNPFPNGVLSVVGTLPFQSGAAVSVVTVGRPTLDHVAVFLVVGGSPWGSAAFVSLTAIGW